MGVDELLMTLISVSRICVSEFAYCPPRGTYCVRALHLCTLDCDDMGSIEYDEMDRASLLCSPRVATATVRHKRYMRVFQGTFKRQQKRAQRESWRGENGNDGDEEKKGKRSK